MTQRHNASLFDARAKEYSALAARERRDSRLKICLQSVPARYRALKLENLLQDENSQRKVFQTVRQYAVSFDKRLAEGTCLVFTGNVGAGKTAVACALLQAVARRGFSARYIACSQMQHEIKHYGYQQEAYAAERFIIPELLVLDETPPDDFHPSDKRRLFDVVDGRYQVRHCTVLISNLNQENLCEAIGMRAFDRLMEGGAMLAFDWPSYRREDKTG